MSNRVLNAFLEGKKKKKKMPSDAGKKGLKFIRWGGIQPEKQKGYKADINPEEVNMHAPPARRGITFINKKY